MSDSQSSIPSIDNPVPQAGAQLNVRDLGIMPYRQAWEIQEQVHEAVMQGGPETILLVEHPAVITWGRRGESAGNLLVDTHELERRGVDLVHSDRGGDITFHGPGQIVAYPIIRLATHGLSVSGYVHKLEAVAIATLAKLEIGAETDPSAVGVWTKKEDQLAKICAIGVRIRRGVTLHGLALNVTTNLSDFQMIVPCGLVSRPVTSVQDLLGSEAPGFPQVKTLLTNQLLEAFHR